MKVNYYVLSIMFYFLINQCWSQIGIEPSTLFDSEFGVYGNRYTKAADVDGDSTLEIFIQGISLSPEQTSFGWVKYLETSNSFSTPNYIEDTAFARSFDAGDIDNDGDIDVVFWNISSAEGIFWKENIDGLGSYGSSNFVDGLNYSSSSEQMYLNDIDNDGDLDIFIAQNRSSVGLEYGWYENIDGLGSFSSYNLIRNIGPWTGTGVLDVVLKDVDNDGDDDIVTLRSYGPPLIWLENLDGLGSFSTEQAISDFLPGGRLKVLEAEDSDGDLDIDVLVSFEPFDDSESNQIVHFEFLSPSEGFSSATILVDTETKVGALRLHDFNNDGLKDLILGNLETSNYEWLPNNGSGSFDAPILIDSNNFGARNLEIIDIDNNGTQDLIATSLDDIVGVYLNTDGLGTDLDKFQINEYLSFSNKIFTRDIDNDGDLDVLVEAGIVDIDKLVWYENLDGMGTFSRQKIIYKHIESVGLKYFDPIVEDLDNDGDLDIFVIGEGNLLAYFDNTDGLGNFNLTQISDELPSISYFDIIDIDNDGDRDFIYKTTSSSSDVMWLENISGYFSGSPMVLFSNDTGGNFSMSVHDINQDGFEDVVQMFGVGGVSWRPNAGDGTFEDEIEIFSTGDLLRGEVLLVDVDNDSDQDIVFPFRDGLVQNIFWFENLGGGLDFLKRNVDFSLSYAGGVSVSDFDLDGDIDILATRAEDNSVQMYENLDGAGNFSDAQGIESFTNDISAFATGDLNSDFKGDFILGFDDLDELIWYKNLGVLRNKLEGSILLDLEDDGCDSSDVQVGGILVSTTNGSNVFSTVTDDNGNFSINVNEGIFTTTLPDVPDYFNMDPLFHTTELTGVDLTETIDFCITTLDGVSDVSLVLFPVTETRPGFDAYYDLIFKNSGSFIESGSISLNFDDVKLDFLESSSPVDGSSIGLLDYNFVDFYPLETRVIRLKFSVEAPPIADNGDVLSFSGEILNSETDSNPDDNVFEFNQVIVGSYDPNDIQVLEGPEVLITDLGEDLNYIIRFQNVGSASAINVLVENDLDANLNWDSFELLSTSHSVNTEIIDGQIKFLFQDINLPSIKTDEEGSLGQIEYRIKPLSSLIVGDQVSNSAKIFFDFNPFIQTNTVVTTFVEPLGVQSFDIKSIIYPNPSQDQLFIEHSGGLKEIKIYSMIGKQVFQKSANTTTIESFDISSFMSGVYLIVLDFGENGQSVEYLIKN
ncbi:MAG: T9SS type A sorting domain-containing protein [Gilvibacter sp.]